jgi:hypothetical protein
LPTVSGARSETTTRPTGSDGIFIINQVAAAPEIVSFFGGPNYMADYAYHKPSVDSATRISVGVGQTVTVNESLRRTNLISGRVTDALTGLPVQGYVVVLTQLSGAWHAAYDWYGQQVDTTDSDGNYTFYHVGSGTFAVCFDYDIYASPEVDFAYARQCYKNRPPDDTSRATPVPVRGFGIRVGHIDQALSLKGMHFVNKQLRN